MEMLMPRITMSTLAVLLTAGAAHAEGKLVALCNVSEIIAATQESRTQMFRFNGRLQTPSVSLALLHNLNVSLKGSPGAIGDNQAFYLMAKIEESDSGSTSISEGYFVSPRKYSPSFERVVPGSLSAHLILKNGDKLEVSCFNPER